MTKPQEKRIAWEEYRNDRDSDIDELDGEDEDDKPSFMSGDMPTLIMGGHQQQIPKELANPFKHFKCHKCNTNFNVTMNMLEGLEKVDGVEIIIPLTRYSFIIAIAKLFPETDVKESVGQAILHKEIIK